MDHQITKTTRNVSAIAFSTLLALISRYEPGRIQTFTIGYAGDHFAGCTSQSESVWRLVNFELWHRAFLDGKGV